MKRRLTIILRELYDALHTRYGDRMVKLVLFGSHARDDVDEGSDIDILLVLRGTISPGEEISRTIDIVTELSLKYDTVLSLVYIDEHSFNHRNGPLLRNIRREGIPV